MLMAHRWGFIERPTCPKAPGMRKSFISTLVILAFVFGIPPLVTLALQSVGTSGFQRRHELWPCKAQIFCFIPRPLAQSLMILRWIPVAIGNAPCKGMQPPIWSHWQPAIALVMRPLEELICVFMDNPLLRIIPER